MLERGNHSGLLVRKISDEGKKFYNTDPSPTLVERLDTLERRMQEVTVRWSNSKPLFVFAKKKRFKKCLKNLNVRLS
jgi:hypothetical protein